MNYDVMDIKNTRFKRGQNDPKVYKESTIFHMIRNILNDAGFDVVRQVPSKDGHMISSPYYIRDRKGRFALTDDNYALRSICEPYNAGEEIRLAYNDLEQNS